MFACKLLATNLLKQVCYYDSPRKSILIFNSVTSYVCDIINKTNMSDVIDYHEEEEGEDDGDIYPPWNFSWIENGKLAVMACPLKGANLRFLIEQGISTLVTLSSEKRPPARLCDELKYITIFVKDFQAPTMEQIKTFIEICERSILENEVRFIYSINSFIIFKYL